MALEGLKRLDLDKDEVYVNRIEEELSIIKDKKFASYFLVIADMINWAKSKEIMVGPGRGSAAGSLVCYTIGITDVDPIKYDLLFFRFINPERNDFPDIDTDFEDRRRKEVKDYLKRKFKHVASISTFTYFKDKGVVRDASRVFMVPLGEVGFEVRRYI
jgi:DNA polymerase-3 subunit alpha